MRAYKNGSDTSVTLTSRQIKKLTDLGFDWSDSQSSNGRSPERLEKIWIERYHEFSEFIQTKSGTLAQGLGPRVKKKNPFTPGGCEWAI